MLSRSVLTRWSCVLRFLLAAPLAAQSRTPPAQKFPAELDRYIASVLSQWRIPGLAIAVVRNDSTLIVKGYGVRQLGKLDRVDENTVFDVAQLTNSFIATAAGMLVDRGALQWDDPVRRHLPDLLLPTDSLTRQATLRDFLTHRTGLEAPETMWTLTGINGEEVRRRTRYLRSLAPFRGAMVYSNIGYMIAGDAAAGAARTTFEALLRDLIIKPLNLRSTTSTYQQATTVANVAAAHATLDGRQQVIDREVQRESIAPADAIRSSAADLARWMRLHINNGVLDGKRYVSDSVMRTMHTIQIRIPANPGLRVTRLMQDTVYGYGLGWRIADYRGHRVLWHAGNGNGQLAYMALFPDERLGIIVLVNTRSAPELPGALVNRTADSYLGYPARDWAGEAFARRPDAEARRAENARAMAAMRSSVPSRLPLTAYAGRYDHPVFGPIWIRPAGSGLTLQMGGGQLGDLEYHGANTFYVVWRDPFFREFNPTHVAFEIAGDSVVSFNAAINQFTARKSAAGSVSTMSDPARPDLKGVEAILGKWNLRMLAPFDVYSSWLEIQRSGYSAVVGRFVGLIGGARPIGKVEWTQGVARFSIPTEWELPSGDIRFEVRVAADSLVGVMVRPDGSMRAFIGKRAPIIQRQMPAAWSAPIPLFNGRDFSGWVPALTASSLPNFWAVRDGVLVNTAQYGVNLMTTRKFQDFKLHAEFRLPEANTSGIFPRGRYWVILSGRQSGEPFKGSTGAVHGFLIPNEDASLGPNTWQAIDITLVGRQITVVVNGKTVISDQIIPGITGSAIDSDEATPGPIMLQGEERRVEFRNITISVPAERASSEEVMSRAVSCATDDTVAAAIAVRTRLAEWVRQANANDTAGMNEVWAPGLVGWFPRAPVYSDSAAYAAAGMKMPPEPLRTRWSYALTIDDVAASGSIVAVHDVWTQMGQLLPSAEVTRIIRSSELWRCQPDGHWRIARWVSAPEQWRLSPQ